MKKILAGSILMSCIFLFIGCGSSEDTIMAELGQKESTGQAEVSEAKQDEKQDSIVNEGFGKIGNDPNNLWQSGDNGRTLAFDDTYIYYSPYVDGLYRVKYDGTENEEIADGYFTSLNVYDGYIYGVLKPMGGDDFAPDIWRIRSDSFEMEQLTEGKSAYTLLVFENMIFYAACDSGVGSQEVHALDLTTMNDEILLECYSQNGIAFTTDGSHVYAFIMQNDMVSVFRVEPSQIRESSEPQKELVNVANGMKLGYFGAVSFTPIGIRSVSGSKDGLKNFLYRDIDTENLKWSQEETLFIKCDSDALFNGNASAVVAQTPRYDLGDNIIALVTPSTVSTTYMALQDYTKGEIYYFEDSNLSEGELIGTIEYDTGCYGKWNDTLYLIDFVNENNISFEIVIITRDGTVTRKAVK